MTTLKELLAQQQALNQQIAALKAQETAAAISKALEIIAEYELSAEELFGAAKGAKGTRKASGKVAPKYKNPTTGELWTGRGRAPKWVVGEMTQYLI